MKYLNISVFTLIIAGIVSSMERNDLATVSKALLVPSSMHTPKKQPNFRPLSFTRKLVLPTLKPAQADAIINTSVDSELASLSKLRDHEDENPKDTHNLAVEKLAWVQVQNIAPQEEDRIKSVSILADLYIETGDTVDETMDGLARLIETYPAGEMRELLESRFLEHNPHYHNQLVEVLRTRSIELDYISESYKDS
jgi:hypothetical protein